MATIAKIHKRLSDIKPGQKIDGAEIVYIALCDGFSKKLVLDVLQNYESLGVVSVVYLDGSPTTISKPSGKAVQW